MVGQAHVGNVNSASGPFTPGYTIPGVTTGSASSSVFPTQSDTLLAGSWESSKESNNDFRDFGTDYFDPSIITGVESNNNSLLSDISDEATMNYWEGLFASVGEENALNRLYNSEEAAKARAFSADEAQKSRDWSERMSNTSYQRAVADLQAAGLNPILAYSQGGASSPTSSMAQSSSASYNVGGGDTFTDILNSFANLISSASDVISSINPFASKSTTRKIGFT